jgi:DNA integrity scanning protein DisA with diadenylate cyclase activity
MRYYYSYTFHCAIVPIADLSNILHIKHIAHFYYYIFSVYNERKKSKKRKKKFMFSYNVFMYTFISVQLGNITFIYCHQLNVLLIEVFSLDYMSINIANVIAVNKL